MCQSQLEQTLLGSSQGAVDYGRNQLEPRAAASGAAAGSQTTGGNQEGLLTCTCSDVFSTEQQI